MRALFGPGDRYQVRLKEYFNELWEGFSLKLKGMPPTIEYSSIRREASRIWKFLMVSYTG